MGIKWGGGVAWRSAGGQVLEGGLTAGTDVRGGNRVGRWSWKGGWQQEGTCLVGIQWDGGGAWRAARRRELEGGLAAEVAYGVGVERGGGAACRAVGRRELEGGMAAGNDVGVEVGLRDGGVAAGKDAGGGDRMARWSCLASYWRAEARGWDRYQDEGGGGLAEGAEDIDDGDKK